jgi:hypothetical protein
MLLLSCYVQPDVDEIEAQRKAAEEALTKAKLKRLAEMQVSTTKYRSIRHEQSMPQQLTITLCDLSSAAAAASVTFAYAFGKKSHCSGCGAAYFTQQHLRSANSAANFVYRSNFIVAANPYASPPRTVF